MTTSALRIEFDHRSKVVQQMRDEGLISNEAFEATLNRIRNETFFAIDVATDIANINASARPN